MGLKSQQMKASDQVAAAAVAHNDTLLEIGEGNYEN